MAGILALMSQPLAAALETLRTLPDVVESWFRAIPPARLDVRRKPDAWTLREHLYHVAGVQQMLMGRILLLRDSPNPEIVPYFPQNQPALAERFPSVDAAFADYHTRRAEQMALLQAVDDTVWNKPAVHPEYERYDLGLLVHHMVFHDYWHFYRMEELWLTRDEYLK
jgi:uncharacterized damage-inducible protein DinB